MREIIINITFSCNVLQKIILMGQLISSLRIIFIVNYEVGNNYVNVKYTYYTLIQYNNFIYRVFSSHISGFFLKQICSSNILTQINKRQ